MLRGNLIVAWERQFALPSTTAVTPTSPAQLECLRWLTGKIHRKMPRAKMNSIRGVLVVIPLSILTTTVSRNETISQKFPHEFYMKANKMERKIKTLFRIFFLYLDFIISFQIIGSWTDEVLVIQRVFWNKSCCFDYFWKEFSFVSLENRPKKSWVYRISRNKSFPETKAHPKRGTLCDIGQKAQNFGFERIEAQAFSS